MIKVLNCWKLYVVDRLKRKEQRKIKKIQVKVLKFVLKRKLFRQKQLSFSSWRNTLHDSNIIQQAQHDILYANEQVRLMRTLLSLSKL